MKGVMNDERIFETRYTYTTLFVKAFAQSSHNTANSLVTELGYYDMSQTYHLYFRLNCCLELGYSYFIALDFSPSALVCNPRYCRYTALSGTSNI